MKNKNKICALILARGGSKRLPDKNIKFFYGSPLITWTIKAAINTNRLDKVYCYSDDIKIINTSIEAGAEAPFERPEIVSGDSISSLETIRYFLKQLKEDNTYYPDLLVLLQPTSPLRTSDHINSALDEVINKKFDLLMSVKKIKSSFKNIRFLSGGKLLNLKNKFKVHIDDFDLYSANGAIYVFNVESLDKNLPPESFRTIPFVMNEIESFDIDTEEEFIISEQIFKINHDKN